MEQYTEFTFHFISLEVKKQTVLKQDSNVCILFYESNSIEQHFMSNTPNVDWLTWKKDLPDKGLSSPETCFYLNVTTVYSVHDPSKFFPSVL